MYGNRRKKGAKRQTKNRNPYGNFGTQWGRGANLHAPSQDPKNIIDSPPVAKEGEIPSTSPEQKQKGFYIDQLPKHLFTPKGTRTVDIRRVADIADGTQKASFMTFTAPRGAVTHFLGYAVFSDGTLGATQEFIPTVNGNRVFTYHGDPNDDFKINLGLGPDLSNAHLIETQLTLNPDEKLEWFVTNTSGVDQAMGVRMVGYIDYEQFRVNQTVGG